MERQSFLIPPFTCEIDGIPVTVLEILKRKIVSGDTWYLAVVTIDYKGIKSRRYTIPVKSEEDLINKLKIEITKIKFIDYGYGIEEVKRLIT